VKTNRKNRERERERERPKTERVEGDTES